MTPEDWRIVMRLSAGSMAVLHGVQVDIAPAEEMRSPRQGP